MTNPSADDQLSSQYIIAAVLIGLPSIIILNSEDNQSLSSALNTSDTGAYHRESDAEIVSMKQIFKISRDVLAVFAVLVTCFCLTFPFFKMRRKADTTSFKIINTAIEARVSALVDSVASTLQKLVSATTFWGHMADYPLNIELTDKSMVGQTLRWMRSTYSFLSPAPREFLVTSAGKGFFQVIRNSTDTHLYYTLFDETEDKWNLKMWDTDSVNVTTWDPETSGEHVRWIEKQNMEWMVPESDSWSTINPLPIKPDGGRLAYIHSYSTGCVMAAIDFEDIHQMIMRAYTGLGISQFILLDHDDNVFIIRGDNAVAPNKDELGLLSYPKLNELGIPWMSELHRQMKSSGSDRFEFIFEDVIYSVMIKNVTVNSQSPFKGVFVVNMNAAVGLSFSPMGQKFIGEILILFLIIILGIWLIKKIQMRHDWKLNHYKDGLIIAESLRYFGSYSKVSHEIKELQMLYPEETTLISTLDKVAENISGRHNEQFLESEQCDQCEFCSHLVEHEHNKIAVSGRTPYMTWHKRIKRRFRFQPEMPLSDLEANPEQFLARFMLDLLEGKTLLFEEFDPDSIMLFVYEFSRFHCKDCLYLVMVIRKLRKLLRGPFRLWIESKVEQFGIYLALMLNEAKPLEQGSVDTNILCDRSSKMEAKWENMKIHVLKYFPMIEKNEHGIQLLKFMRQIIEYIQDDQALDILGRLRIRMESKSFNVEDTLSDRCLFIANMIRLAYMSPYLWPEEEMVRAVKRITARYLTEQEAGDEQLVNSFHYIQAERVARPILDIFRVYVSLSEMAEKLENTIEFWRKRIEEVELPSNSQSRKSRSSSGSAHDMSSGPFASIMPMRLSRPAKQSARRSFTEMQCRVAGMSEATPSKNVVARRSHHAISVKSDE